MSAPKLTLVGEALAAVPHAAKDEIAITKVLEAFGPAYAKRAREEERATARRAAEAHAAALQAAALQAAQSAYEHAAAKAHAAGKAHGFWKGATVGGTVVGAIVGTGLAIYAAAVINPAFDAAARFQMQQGVVDTLDRSVGP